MLTQIDPSGISDVEGIDSALTKDGRGLCKHGGDVRFAISSEFGERVFCFLLLIDARFDAKPINYRLKWR